MRVSARSRNLVYRGISRNDNHCSDRGDRTPHNAAIGALEGIAPGLCGAAQEFRPLSGTRPMACRAMRRRWSDRQCRDLGRRAAHLRQRREERGRRRTRQDQISPGPQDHSGFETAGEIADHEIRTERRKLVSSAGPVFERANSLERTIQPFDLMSRRHPLSSMEPPELEFASREAKPFWRL